MVKITPPQIPTTQDSPSSRWGRGGGGEGFPIENTGDESLYIPPKFQNFMLLITLNPI